MAQTLHFRMWGRWGDSLWKLIILLAFSWLLSPGEEKKKGLISCQSCSEKAFWLSRVCLWQNSRGILYGNHLHFLTVRRRFHVGHNSGTHLPGLYWTPLSFWNYFQLCAMSHPNLWNFRGGAGNYFKVLVTIKPPSWMFLPQTRFPEPAAHAFT